MDVGKTSGKSFGIVDWYRCSLWAQKVLENGNAFSFFFVSVKKIVASSYGRHKRTKKHLQNSHTFRDQSMGIGSLTKRDEVVWDLCEEKVVDWLGFSYYCFHA